MSESSRVRVTSVPDNICYNIEHNDTQHCNTQYNDAQHDDTQRDDRHYGTLSIMTSVQWLSV